MRNWIFVLALGFFPACAVKAQDDKNLVAIVTKQSHFEEVKNLAHWKAIYYRPEATKYGCNFGDVPPPRDREYTVYFDDAPVWPLRIIIPQYRGCAFAYQRIKGTDQRIGGIAYWGLTGVEFVDRYGVEHEISHMQGRGLFNIKELVDWTLFSVF